MDVACSDEPVAYHFSASKWAALKAKFSNPEKWFYFRVSYAGSRFASERVQVLARSKSEALHKVLEDSTACLMWYQQTDRKFKPLNSKKHKP